MHLTKELIYETVYQLVSDSTEWGVEEGKLAMVNSLMVQ